ncbi:hypothetical protein WJM97_12030 [Okeanomitos corallinicola TIOX110]|uniref:SpoVT-AbrB domain-containing protein n=1 Tax=Okeanomitos corallinicola TIOX110 TaxID=3133117 RepID=A0ABZ2ULU8_9CYAN
MSRKIFRLEVKEGLLILPPEVREYLRQCPEESEIDLMIQPPLSLSFQHSDIQENNQQDIQMKWNNWLKEVEQLEILPADSPGDDYGSALLKKYRSQGFDI